MARQINGHVGNFTTSTELTTKFSPSEYIGCSANVGTTVPYVKYWCNGQTWAAAGGGGASAFTDLTDKATADLPVINTPLGSALAAKAPLASPTFTGTVGGITKSMVGLGSVDNTADTAKPVSTAQTTAFAVLGPYASAGALETAKPAASNGGRVALVGASAPYAPYMSDGTTWGSLSQSGGDPYVAIATSGTSQSINIGSAGVVDITLTADCTLSFTGAVSGAAFSLRLILRQDSPGSRSVAWPAGTKWTLGAAPTLSTPANSIDEVVLMTYDGGTSFFGDFVARARA